MGVFDSIFKHYDPFKHYKPTKEETKAFKHKRKQNIRTGDISEYEFVMLEIEQYGLEDDAIQYKYTIRIDSNNDYSVSVVFRRINYSHKTLPNHSFREFKQKIEDKLLLEIKKSLAQNNFLGFKKNELLVTGTSITNSIKLHFENNKKVYFSDIDYDYSRLDILFKEIKNIIDFDNYLQNILKEIKKSF